MASILRSQSDLAMFGLKLCAIILFILIFLFLSLQLARPVSCSLHLCSIKAPWRVPHIGAPYSVPDVRACCASPHRTRSPLW